MCEHGPPHHISDRINSRSLGLQIFVDWNPSFLINFKTCGIQIEPLGIGTSTNRNEAVIRIKFNLLLFFVQCLDNHLISKIFSFLYCVAEEKLNPLFFQGTQHFLAQASIHRRNQTVQIFHHLYFSTQT